MSKLVRARLGVGRRGRAAGRWAGVLGLLWLAAACGGGNQAEPTALPAEAVIPAQPTVLWPTFTPIQPGPTLTPTAPPAPEDRPTPTWTPFPRTLPTRAPFRDALAIPQQTVALRQTPNGDVIANLPSNQYLTAVAQSEDGQWLAVRTEDNQYGWVAREEVKVYGEVDNLRRTAERVPWASAERATTDAQATRAPLDPRAMAVGVTNAGGLRIRSVPNTDTGTILASLDFNAELSVLGRNAAGSWLKISLLGTPASQRSEEHGWVFARFVDMDRDVATLPVAE